MNPIQLFGLGNQSRSANVTAQNRVNMYLENSSDQGKPGIVAYRTPGLRSLMTFGGNPVRGWYAANSHFYTVCGSILYEVTSAYVATNIGTLLTSSGEVSMSSNGLELIIVDGANGYTYNFGTMTFAQIVAAGFPGGNTVTFLNSFFIVNAPNSGRFQLSASYDGMTWDAADVATAEANPDNLLAVIADHGELILIGDVVTEIWAGVESVSLPFQKAGSAIEWGCVARKSIVKLDNSLFWLARNISSGQVQVIRLDGYNPVRVSTHDIESIINSYSNIESATALAYLHNGHPFYQINFAEGSWIYDVAMQSWSQVKGYGIDRHRANYSLIFNGVILLSDFENGNVYTPDAATYDDNGQPLISSIKSQHVFNGGDRISFSKMWIDAEMGVGISSGQGDNPQIALTIYKDHGHIPTITRYANLGKIGEYNQRIIFTRLGQARDFVFELSVSDPVKFVLLGAYVQ